MRKVIHDAARIGTGVLKAPFPDVCTKYAYSRQKDAAGKTTGKQDFDGYQPIQADLTRSMNRAHAASGDFLEQFIITEPNNPTRAWCLGIQPRRTSSAEQIRRHIRA